MGGHALVYKWRLVVRYERLYNYVELPAAKLREMITKLFRDGAVDRVL